MGRSGDLAPYDTAHIEAPSEAEAIQRAKRWADEVVLADDSHLQVLFDGKAVASFKPGEF
jgi:hypothetical protein